KKQNVEIKTYVADLADFRLSPNSYDGIVSIFCHLPAPVRRRLHADAAASLKKGGVFLLEAYTPQQLKYGTGGPPVKELLMQLAELRLEFPGLDIVHGQEMERDVREGRLHTGKGSVVQIIAVKK
ncbi:MAG: class I SAM-dependent methyltransferase, partial [Desulforhopalus sp.]